MSYYISLLHDKAWSKTIKEAMSKLLMMKNKSDDEFLSCFYLTDTQ